MRYSLKSRKSKIVNIIISSFLLLFLYPYINNARAAEVTIDSSVNSAIGTFNSPSPTTVFISDQVGYVFYRDSGGACVYSKTTNGGGSWGAAVTVDGQTDCIKIVVWYDQWTPGDNTGTYIYIWTMDSGADDVWYNRLDTASDTRLMGTNPVSISTDKTNTLGAGNSANDFAAVKSTTGVLYISLNDGGGVGDESWVKRCSTSCNTAGNWSDAGQSSPWDNASGDHGPFLPLLGGDLLQIRLQDATNDIQSKTYRAASNSWASSWTTIDADATNNNTYDSHMGALVNKQTGYVYLVYAASVSTLGGNDDDIRTAVFNGTSWTAKTDVITDDTRGITNAKIAMDQNTGELYCLYSAQTTPNTASTGRVYYKKSTNGMTSWGSEQGPLNASADDIYGPQMNILSNERIYAVWNESSTTRIQGDTISDLSAVQAYAASGNFSLKSYSFGGGGGVGESANYSSETTVGEGGNNDAASSNYKAGSGLNYTQQANVPRTPVLQNTGTWNNKLQFIVDPSANPSDSTFAIAISTDNFTTTNYIQSDNTIGSSLGPEDFQTYTTWGGASGGYVIGLTANTTYKIKVKARQGKYTESAWGPTASAATSTLQLSFDIDVSATDSDTSAPYVVAMGTLTSGSVTTATNKVWIDLDTNAPSGGFVYVYDQYSGLRSAATNYTISSVSNDLGSVSEGFGIQSATAVQSGGGPLVASSPYNGTSNTVGLVDTTIRLLYTTSGSQISGARGSFTVKAKSAATTPASSDYSDTLTLISAASF